MYVKIFDLLVRLGVHDAVVLLNVAIVGTFPYLVFREVSCCDV